MLIVCSSYIITIISRICFRIYLEEFFFVTPIHLDDILCPSSSYISTRLLLVYASFSFTYILSLSGELLHNVKDNISLCGVLMWILYVESLCGVLMWSSYVESLCGVLKVGSNVGA